MRTDRLPRKAAGAERPKETGVWQEKHTRAPSACRVGEPYLDQQLEARDPLEGQDEEGGEGQPPALGVELQLRDQLPKGRLLLAGDKHSRVGLWLPTHSLVGTRQPTGTECTLIFFFILTEINYSVVASYAWPTKTWPNVLCVGGQACLVWPSLWIRRTAHGAGYPAGARGKVNPRSDGNRQQLETTAGNLCSSCQVGAPRLQMGRAVRGAPGTCHWS